MKTLRKIYDWAMDTMGKVMRHHVGAYAAQAAYFFMLSMIPIILLLLTLIRFTPVTKADVLTAVIQVFPSTVDSMVTSIINEVYNQSMAIVPITILVALWAAGKGVLSLTTGLNNIYECPETRNYFFLRGRATVYTILFILVIIVLLLLSVFGNSLIVFVSESVPILATAIRSLVNAFAFITPVLLVGFSLLIYRYLPNRKDRFIKQLPGAIFTAVGWLIVSWIFSVYLDIFQGFSSMYGSLTTIVLIMLWLYFLMYITLLGAELNMMLYDKIFVQKKRKRRRGPRRIKDGPQTQ